MHPFEVSYKTVGRKGKRERNVIGVLCPNPIALYMGIAHPIFGNLGDVSVDWTAPITSGYKAMFEIVEGSK